jgi:hypothetical protein
MMAKSFVALLIVGSLHSQEVSTKGQVPCPDQEVRYIGPGVSVNQRHDQLRRGREDEFAVVLCSPQLPYGGCGANPHPTQTGIVPVTFNIDVPAGLTVRYRQGRKYRPVIPGTPVQFAKGSKILLLKIIAAHDAPLGTQTLHGTLAFQSIQSGKTAGTQQVAIDFKVIVVEHNATVAESEWPFGSQVGRHLKSIALAPLVPFEALLFVIACSTSACDI